MDQHDLTSQPTSPPTLPGRHGMGTRRIVGSLVLAAGLLGIGGASVVLAASPAPSASTTPSTQSGGSGGTHAMPGGCPNMGTNGSSGSGSTTPSSSSATNG